MMLRRLLRSIAPLSFVLVLVFVLAAAGEAGACPRGFLDVTSRGRSLGCVQEDVERSPTSGSIVQRPWFDSAQYCFDTYGGRHPTAEEYTLAALNTTLLSPGGSVWTTDMFFSDTGEERAVTGQLTGGVSIDLGYRVLSNNGLTRCWIAADQVAMATVPSVSSGLVLVFVVALVVSAWRTLGPRSAPQPMA